MARVTVEDCLQNVDNLFQLVLLASQRARRLANGAEPTVAIENDKVTVVALREIAAGNITPEMLRERRTDSAETIARRLADASSDMSHYDEFDYVVVNDRFERAAAELGAILDGGGGELRSNRPDLAPLIATLVRPGPVLPG